MARQRTVASRHARRPSAAGGDVAPVGRDDLLGRLRRAVDEAVAGRGLIVLLTGEAGIGKTTLLKEADRFIAMLGGVVPVREFMSPRTIIGLVGVRGFARLVAGQARRGHPPADPMEPVGGGEPKPQRAF